MPVSIPNAHGRYAKSVDLAVASAVGRESQRISRSANFVSPVTGAVINRTAVQEVIIVMTTNTSQARSLITRELGGAGTRLVDSLVNSVGELLSNPKPQQLTTARRTFNSFVASASETFLVNPPDEFLAVHAILDQLATTQLYHLPEQAYATMGGALPSAWKKIVPPIEQQFADGKNWLLRDSMVYQIGQTRKTIVVPPGFVTDHASVPQLLWNLLPPTGTYSLAAIVHDFLYWTQTCRRDQADRLLLIAMKESQVPASYQWMIYTGVHLGGEGAWKANAKERLANAIRIVPTPYDTVPPNTTWIKYRSHLRRMGLRDGPFSPVDAAVCALGDSVDVPNAPSH